MMLCTVLPNIVEKLGGEPSPQRLDFVSLGQIAFVRPMTLQPALVGRRPSLSQSLASSRSSALFSFSISLAIGSPNGGEKNTLAGCASTTRSPKPRSPPFVELKMNITAKAQSFSAPLILMKRRRIIKSQSADKCPLMQRQDFSPINRTTLPRLGDGIIEFST